MLEYFSSNLGRTIQPLENPAEFILDVTGAGISKQKAKGNQQVQEDDKDSSSSEIDSKEEQTQTSADDDIFVKTFKNSEFFKETERELEKGIYPINQEQAKKHGRLKRRWAKMKSRLRDRYATTFGVQFKEVLARSFLSYWRKPEYDLHFSISRGLYIYT